MLTLVGLAVLVVCFGDVLFVIGLLVLYVGFLFVLGLYYVVYFIRLWVCFVLMFVVVMLWISVNEVAFAC